MLHEHKDLEGSFFDIDWETELKTMGGLAGTVVASHIAERLAFTLGLQVLSTIAGFYGGVWFSTLTYITITNPDSLEQFIGALFD